MQKNINKIKFLKLIGIFIIIFSIIFILAGSFSFMTPKIKSSTCTESVNAQVIENIIVKNNHKKITRRKKTNYSTTSITYKPVFSFTYNGIEYKVESETSSNPPAFENGEFVELKIDPNNPENFYAPSDKTTTILGIIFTGIGAVFLIIGIIFEIIATKKKNHKNYEYL